MTNVTPLERQPRVQHIDTPLVVRERSIALSVRASRVAGVLRAPAAMPDMRERAKADLIGVAEEALTLWKLL